MRYEGQIYRPPSEARSYILQATIGCSWNHCTYCDMYRQKSFRVRELDQTLEDVRMAGDRLGPRVEKVFVADGDALVMDLAHWEAILDACRASFPRLRQVSSYATAMNVNAKAPEDLARLRELGLTLLYMGPETGDDQTFKEIAKGANAADHVSAARRAHDAGMRLSTIFLLGAAGSVRGQEHARATADLITDMDPEYVSLLTLTVVPGTPLARLRQKGRFELPEIDGMLRELRTVVAHAQPSRAVFRTNHASNYLPMGGNLPDDREHILAVIDAALSGRVPLRSESSRGL